jgi:(1->4)-alpha-D-glucan 1-alpha-D-glucosylmutase
MLKAVREAKVHSSWLTTNQPYEDAVSGFVERILGPAGGPKFLPAFLPFQQQIAEAGIANSLSQAVLKLGSPGVPDFYQGTELWDLNLVDPDNRRPVDFALREKLLDRVIAASPADPGEMLAHWRDGRIKLFVTWAGLQLRRELPAVFVGGDYVPLPVESSLGGDAIAFARVSGDDAVLVIAAIRSPGLVGAHRRLPLGGDGWKTSRVMLPETLRTRTFRNVFTTSDIRPIVAADSGWIFLGQALETLPVALLRAV